MKKELTVSPALFPMPVLMIATYNDDGSVDVMNMAWGGICDTDKVAMNLSESHTTCDNLKKRRAFTISVADVPHLAESDFFGTASAGKMPDKFARTGFHAVKSEKVDAPVVEEYPITLECQVIELGNCVSGFRVVGQIVGVLADERVLDQDGKVDPAKLGALVYDPYRNGYYAVGEKVGQAWNSGMGFLK